MNSGTRDYIEQLARFGALDCAKWLLKENHVLTKRELDTDKEEIYVYSDGIYVRGEELIRNAAKGRFISAWEECLESIADQDAKDQKSLLGLEKEMQSKIAAGPSTQLINQVMAHIRLDTFTDISSFNPPTHIPFRNGFLSLRTRELEPLKPEIPFLWRVEADLDIEKVSKATLKDCPMYASFLMDGFERYDIPLLLQYGGYAFHPEFPIQKILIVAGRPRIGKGTNARIWRGLNPSGYGSVSFEKLLIAENRFAFQGIEGKNLLCDPEMRRKFRKGSRPDYANLNKLFGGDTVDMEKKNRSPMDYENKAKGLFIGNLPLYPIDDEPFLQRVLLVKARDNVLKKQIKDLDKLILDQERNEIAALYVRYLFLLLDRDEFVNQLEIEGTFKMWDDLARPVLNFLDEMVERVEGAQVDVDHMVETFDDWCLQKGIPIMKPQTAKREIGRVYPVRRPGAGNSRARVFTDCQIVGEVLISVQHKLDAKSSSVGAVDLRSAYYRYPHVQHGYMLHETLELSKSFHDMVPKLDAVDPDPKNAVLLAPAETKVASNLITLYRITLPSHMKGVMHVATMNGEEHYHDQDIVTDIPDDILDLMLERGFVKEFRVNGTESEAKP